ncbi:MAG: polysaccharide biosynthesis tyrosine autokinase, partial [Oxalobacteraceae bacterium]|nr:polysaccharide biosynthesis tyrosine autokinase [Oxalobacteraceae bacterium]
MTVVEYFQAIRRGWAVVLALLVICGSAAFGVSQVQTPIYQASCRLFVAMGGVSEQSSNIAGAAQFAAQRVRSYTQVVSSPNVLQPIIDQLDLGGTPLELSEKLSVTNPLDTVLLDVKAKDTDAVAAASIANLACSYLGAEIEKIETLKTGLATNSAVTVSVISPATAPLQPVSPRKLLNLALGLLLGLAIGAGIVILRETLDTRIKDASTIVDRIGASPIGVIPFDPDRKMTPLVALSSRSFGSEAFRAVRTNLQYVNVDNPPKVFVITSSVPNEGKSTTTANLAITFALNGAKVLVIEADLRLPRLAAYLGTESSVGLTDVLAGNRDLEDVVVPFRDGLFDLLPAGKVPPNPSELLGSDHMRHLLNSVRSNYDVT